jgi:hypothetical protein
MAGRHGIVAATDVAGYGALPVARRGRGSHVGILLRNRLQAEAPLQDAAKFDGDRSAPHQRNNVPDYSLKEGSD